MPQKEDYLLRGKDHCQRYDELLEDAYNSSFVRNIEEEDSELLAYLGRESGLNATDLLVSIWFI